MFVLYVRLFEGVLGVKVNFNKSMLVGVHVGDFWLVKATLVSLAIGGDMLRLNCWVPLLDCIKSTLSGWKSKNLSCGYLLVLLKSVMFTCIISFA